MIRSSWSVRLPLVLMWNRAPGRASSAWPLDGLLDFRSPGQGLPFASLSEADHDPFPLALARWDPPISARSCQAGAFPLRVCEEGGAPLGCSLMQPTQRGVAARRGGQGTLVAPVKDVLGREAPVGAKRADLELLEHLAGRRARALPRDLGRQVGRGESPRIPMLAAAIGPQRRDADRTRLKPGGGVGPTCGKRGKERALSLRGARFGSNRGAGQLRRPAAGFGALRARTTPRRRSDPRARRNPPATTLATLAGSPRWAAAPSQRPPPTGRRPRSWRPASDDRRPDPDRRRGGVAEDASGVCFTTVPASVLRAAGFARGARFVAPSAPVCYKGAVFSNPFGVNS